MIKITINKDGTSAKIKQQFKTTRKKNAEAMRKGTKAAAATAYLMVFENLSGPYSLSTLAGMGHPYSLRWSQVSVPGIEPFVINKQSGDLRSSLKLKFDYANQHSTAWSVGFDRNAPRYTGWVIGGTYKMHSRDVIGRTLNNPVAYNRMLQSFLTVYRKHK